MDAKHADTSALGAVREIMTASVVAVEPGWPLGRAARELERVGVSGAPVIEDGALIGVVTLGDMLRGAALPTGPVATSGPWLRHEHDLDRSGRVVADVMSRRPVTVREEESVVEAAVAMQRAHVSRLPVVDGGGRVVGIITRDDVVAAVARAGTVS